MKRVAYCGLGPLAENILRYLATQPVEIVGVDSKTDREGQINILSVAQELGLPIKSYDEITELKPDILLSVSYLRMVKKELLDSTLCVNLHVAKLPEYKGRNPFTMAIQNGDETYTTTMHLMVEELDAGDIIAERNAPIYFGDTAKSLYDRMQDVSYRMFVEEWPKILNGTFTTKPQEGESRTYTKELQKEVDFQDDPVKLYDQIRSLDFPPYEPAYYYVNGDKIHITQKEYVLWLLSRGRK